MATFSEIVRRATTFLLALFLWFHALFFLNIQSTFVSRFTRVLRLAPSEAVLFSLLVVFSFLAASGFWRTLLSLAYIYFFPFVLIGHLLRWCFLLLRAMNRWFKAQAHTPQIGSAVVVEQNAPPTAPLLPEDPVAPVEGEKTATEILRFLTRPFG